MNVDEENLARQLWALGDVVRLRILRRLPRSPECKSRNNVSQLAEDLGLSQPTLSHHLRILRQVGLVSYKKMCRDVFYWLNEDAANLVAEHLCEVVSHQDVGEQIEVAQRDE